MPQPGRPAPAPVALREGFADSHSGRERILSLGATSAPGSHSMDLVRLRLPVRGLRPLRSLSVAELAQPFCHVRRNLQRLAPDLAPSGKRALRVRSQRGDLLWLCG